jgi:hypothetical protein
MRQVNNHETGVRLCSGGSGKVVLRLRRNGLSYGSGAARASEYVVVSNAITHTSNFKL